VRRTLAGCVAVAAAVLAAGPAAAFSVLCGFYGSPQEVVSRSCRWNAEPFQDTGLHDGIQVAVQPGIAELLGATNENEVGLVALAIHEAFMAWKSPVLRFEIEHESALAAEGTDLGAEIDVFAVPQSHPVFQNTDFFGFTPVAAEFVSGRLLTNGQRTDGDVITGADVLLNADRLKQTRIDFGLPLELARPALTRLLIHEIGHALGLAHPNLGATVGENFDTDFDPSNAMVIDPLDPFGDLIASPFHDQGALMSNEPCGGPFAGFCPELFLRRLRPDDRGGRDVLYPVPEPGTAAALALGLTLLARVTRRVPRSSGSSSASSKPSPQPDFSLFL
jgi:hypothetical protein